MYKNILFDLDGTLTDSKPGIISSLCQAFQYYDIDYCNMDLNNFIGPPLMNTLVEVIGFDNEKASGIVTKYREYYSQKGIYENSLYDGIEDMLIRLKTDGYSLFIATSKPLQYTNIVLEYFHISHYFTYVAASVQNLSFDYKQRIIEDIIEQCDITDFNTTAMVGDRKHDIVAAKTIGITAIGVLYGYGDFKELSDAGADFIVEDIQGLYRIINSNIL